MGSRTEELERLRPLAEAAAGGCGVEVVEVRYHAQGVHSLLRIDIDRAGPAGVTLQDCECVSRGLDRALEEAGLLQDTRYDLQVSSPGLDRPIRTEDDFRRNTGRALVLEVAVPGGRSETVRGVLLGATGEEIRVRNREGTESVVPRGHVRSASQDPEPGGAPRASRPRRKSGRPRGIV